MNVYGAIEDFISYAKIHLGLPEDDVLYTKNAVFNLLDIHEDGEGETRSEKELSELAVPDSVIAPIYGFALEMGIVKEEERALFETALMGLVTPKPSEVNAKFCKTLKESGCRRALLDFYDMCVKTNYIKMTDVNRNIKWTHKCEKADIEITVNLSKPEKDNKEIARLKSAPNTGFPKCMLCKENVNYQGRLNYPARQTLRYVPLTLAGEKWFMQYSPYVYFNEHCIIFKENHAPMSMGRKTFERLSDFVDEFPCYMIGSNACIPIVGGSILSHEHYQGGEHLMPMHFSKPETEFSDDRNPDVKIYITDWYNSDIRLESENKKAVIDLAEKIFDSWTGYSDESVGIIAKTDEVHNAITPIMRRKGNLYSLDLLLRNNRTDETYPDGIFHAHPEYHNIKKEGIGLIEAMGLFILPGRLEKECKEIKKFLTGERKDSDYKSPENVLYKHAGMIEDLMREHGNGLSESEAETAVREYIGNVCLNILGNTAVFKKDEKGQEAFRRFMAFCGFKKV